MTTLHTAIMTLVNNLQTKMTSDTPLTPEEQTLVATAIDKLSNHGSLENALVAVAEAHLGEATQALTEGVEEATETLKDAETAITSAKNTIATEGDRFAHLGSELQLEMQQFIQENMASINASRARPVFGMPTYIETRSTDSKYSRSQAIFAVYDASGETFAVRPSFAQTTTTNENNKLEFLKLSALGESYTSLRHHFLHSSFYATPSTHIYYHGTVAILPLAQKADPDNITYEAVYSTQNKADATAAYYQGVYCRRAGYATATKPKKNLNALDQWGISTYTAHSYAHNGVLYDNLKHCLVMVDHNSGRIIEKYADGNITLETVINSATELQSYVDAGDFTVVRFIYVHLPWPSAQYISGGASTNIGNTTDCWGYFGHVNGSLRMGGNVCSVHYRFTADKKLEPLNYHFMSSVQYASTSDAAQGNVRVAITSTDNQTLGVYHYQVKSNYPNTQTGYLANALMCMNPYSHVGILNEYYSYHYNSIGYYGIGRICRAF